MAVFLLPISLFGQTAGESDTRKPAEPADGDITIKRTGLMFVGKASDPKVYSEVKDAKATFLAPAFEWEYGVRLFTKARWKAQDYVWADFLRDSAKLADSLVDGIEPRFYRDDRDVIVYAEITHDDPFFSSILLSKRFLPRFEREFGKRLHVLILGRNRIFVFPADGGKLASYGPSLANAYRDTPFRVSLEIFLVDESGFRVAGEIER